MSITTFAGLAAVPNAQKDYLVIIRPKMRLQNWTKTGGNNNVYEITFASLYSCSTEFGNTWRVIYTVKENNTAYAEQANVAAVDADNASYWHDTANNKLYIHAINSDDPDTTTYFIIVTFELYFSSGIGLSGKGKIFSDIYYEPLFNSASIPSFDYEQSDILSGGGISSGSGTLEFKNHHKFWNTMWKAFTWKNAQILVKLGGEELPLTEYSLVIAGRIREETWRDDMVSFLVVNELDILKRSIPINSITGANVAEVDKGKPVPLCFGTVTGIKPLWTDNSVGDAGVYTIADANFQTLKAIDVVYDGITDVTGNVTKDLTNCKFTFNAYTPTGEVTCDVQGAKISDITGESDTDLMINASDKIRFFLKTIFGYADAGINLPAFAAAKLANTFTLAKYVRYRRNLASYFQDIERSVFGNIYIDNDGKWSFVIFEPYLTEDDDIDNEEIASFEVKSPLDRVYSGVKVYYDASPKERDEGEAERVDDTYLVEEVTNNNANYLYGQKEAHRNIYTWIKNQSDAAAHASRLAVMTDIQSTIINMRINGIKLYERKPGDLLLITRADAPTLSGALADEKFQILRITKEFAASQCMLMLDDLRGFGSGIGFWIADAAPNYGASSEQQKREQGYWSDTNGLADPTDPTSLNVSRWW